MSELTIRRNREVAAVQMQKVEKAEKQTAGGEVRKTAKAPGVTVSETLQRLMTRDSRVESHARESRRAMQMGEAVLAEVKDSLGRMEELAKKAAGGGGIDRGALQEELERLKEGIERALTGASGDVEPAPDGTEGEKGELPAWLLRGIAQGSMTADQILSALGLDRTASGSDILAALAGSALDSDAAAGYLAALYLGAVIAGGTSGTVDPSRAMEGLRRLMEEMADGASPDEAIMRLTGGEFTSFAEFQSQFTDGTAEGLQEFLVNLLLSDGGLAFPADMSLMDLLAGMDGMNMALLMDLLTALQSGETGSKAAAPDGAAGPAAANAAPSVPISVLRLGNMEVMGRDLSGVSFDTASGELTVSGTEPVTIRGTGEGEQAVLLTGSGTVTVQNMKASVLTVRAADAHLVTAGQNVLGQVVLEKDASLTLDGGGLLQIDSLRGNASNALRLTGGAVVMTPGKTDGGQPGVLTVPVLVDGPVSLAARAVNVRDFSGKTLEPMDIVWRTLLPGFSTVTSMEVDGRHVRMRLPGGGHSELVRLWLDKGDPSSHGSPLHALTVRGRDALGRNRTRYAYLLWSQREGKFQEVSMYPNPFTVTGGEAEQDWVYEEDSHTLRILSSQVTAVSGGSGLDANQEPFSGRIALADGIGVTELTLDGVVCRVSSGRAFHLGRENDVTLILPGGTANFFESGAGFAGISLGEGTSLRINCTGVSGGDGNPSGTLTATGGSGGVGIGQDGGGSRGLSGQIRIHGGLMTGTEKPGAAGSVTIVGGTGGTGSVDRGTARLWARMGVFLQVGEDTVILPQFHLSSRAMRLDRLRVSTREAAQAAQVAIGAERRRVSRIQASYSALYMQLERDLGSSRDGGGDSPVRDDAAAGRLLRDMRQSISLQSDQAVYTHSRRGKEDVEQLFR